MQGRAPELDQMLQALVEDRFKLKVHWETKRAAGLRADRREEWAEAEADSRTAAKARRYHRVCVWVLKAAGL